MGDINVFIEKYNEGKKNNEKWSYFSPDDLNKIALYQATGSGKTLVSHINYLQYIHHYNKNNKEPLDMILLITPNESLSHQHKEEFEKS
jgi:superfamily II DNA/RNA helicase